MRRRSFVTVSLLALLPLMAACSDDGDTPTDPETPAATFDLTFTGDDTFQGAHGGQTIHVGVKRASNGELVASDQGTVSSTANPSFEFTFADVLVEGESYNLDYWIDSNFNGGTEGSCDPPETDHQWRLTVSSVTADVTVDDTHRPTETEDVCGTSDGTTDPGY